MKLNILAYIIGGLLVIFFIAGVCGADEIDSTKAIRAIIGEASDQGYQGMLAVAVGLRNRGHFKGVYGLKAKHVDSEPKYVWDRAKRAWEESLINRIHNADHWHNIKREGENYWTKKMVKVYEYKDHVFYKESK